MENKAGKEHVLFLSPPAWDMYTPFSAVPCLAAALKEEGIACRQFDLGIMCFRTLLVKDWKNSAHKFMTEGFYKGSVKKYWSSIYADFESYLEDLWFFKGDAFPIDEVKARYKELNRIQMGVLDFFYQNLYSRLVSGFESDKENDLRSCVEKYDLSLLMETISHFSLSEDLYHAPKVTGISVTGVFQFLPALALARIIREHNPETKIVMGGSCVEVFLASDFVRKEEIFEYCDYLICGEGETALTRLYRYLSDLPDERKISLADIPNLIWQDDNGTLRRGPVLVEEVTELPPPCYDGLDLELYLSPEVMLPYQTSRGCHYGYCAFCNHSEMYRHNYRSKDMKKVVQELVYLKERYHVSSFQFVDEAIRPDCFAEMVEEMENEPRFTQVKWIFYSRVSRYYTEEMLQKGKKNGCEMVMFGVETFSQRLLQFVKKGISADTSRYCIQLFSKCGIKTFIWLMCNLPGETPEEVREDMKQVRENVGDLARLSVAPFYLEKNTDMFRNMEAFGITSYDPYDSTKFMSVYEGEIVDQEEVLRIYAQEYRPMIRQYFFSSNRYTIFFQKDTRIGDGYSETARFNEYGI